MGSERGGVLAGKYELGAVLGEGGMGTVFRARHLELGEDVAIKFLSPALTGRHDLVERFFREARAAVRIKSEHVARVMDVGRDESGAPYLVMELLDGEDLESLLARRGALPMAEACNYVLQACDAIAEAHALGIVHRDIKPANLFLTKRSNGLARVKVLDFGISKDTGQAGSVTRTSAIMGSPAYMSPEQLRSTKEVDGRSDIWSLGVVLFELLSGSLPFAGESVADISASILRSTAAPLAPAGFDLPDGLVTLVERCLSKDPAGRPGSVRELASELERYASPETKRVVEPALLVGSDRSRPEIASAPTRLAESEDPIVVATRVSGLDARRPPASATDATVEIDSRPTKPAGRWPALAIGTAAVAVVAVGVWWGGRGPELRPPAVASMSEQASAPSPDPSAPRPPPPPTVPAEPPPAASEGMIVPSARPSSSTEVGPKPVSPPPRASAGPVPPVAASAPPVSEFGGRK